jgi:PPOX class probable F420-dependent enzyme
MSAEIPEQYRDLFDKKAFASLATIMPNGQPQVTPVWCDFDGSHVIVNSAKGRRKDRNMRSDPRVSLAISDPDNPYRYLEVRGTVVEITEDGADDHIDSMAKKYMGVDKYPYRQPGEVRVVYKIEPQRFSFMG